MNKVKGYTVIEMLVVMLISAISIGVTYTTYRIFARQYLTYKHNSEDIAQYVLLDRLLSTDFLKSDKVLKTGDGLLIQLKLREVRYEFGEEYILRRDQSLVDTFKIQPTGVSYWWDGQEQHVPDRLVDQLKFESTYKEEKLDYVFLKKYGADAWMYEETLNDN
jgi:prepilin-type N-terminal cleavage/methylation domain-containing protein